MQNLSLLLCLLLSFSSTAQVIQATASTVVESENMRFVIRNDGSLFHQDGETGQFTTNNENGETPTLLNYAGLWLSGQSSIQYVASIATVENLERTDFAPGPTYFNYGDWSLNRNLSLDKQAVFNQIWGVSDAEIVAHVADFLWDGKVDTIRENVYLWPGYGNKHFQQLFDNTEAHEVEERYLVQAPFYDTNLNNLYEPHLGDYPRFIHGRESYSQSVAPGQMYYTIYNDCNKENPMFINVHQTVAIADCDSPTTLNKTIVANYNFINKSNSPIDSFNIGWLIDPALGCPEDDYAGTDTLNNRLYFYNGDDYDGSSESEMCAENGVSFQEKPPVLSFSNLRNEWTNTMYMLPTGGFTPGAQAHPQDVTEYYYYMRNLWRDGSPQTLGGNGYGGEIGTAHIYHGNPVTQEGWTMRPEFLNPDASKRYFIASTAHADYYPNQNQPDWWSVQHILPPGESSIQTVIFNFNQDNTIEETLVNAPLTLDTIGYWLQQNLDWAPEFDLGYEINCNLPWPRAPRPIVPVVALYPNPAHDLVTVRLSQQEMKHFRFYNISGQLILETEFVHDDLLLEAAPELIQKAEIDISSLPAGFYVLQIEGVNEEIQTHKFLKL